MSVARLARITVLSLIGLMVVATAAVASPRPSPIVFDRAGDLYALRLGHHPMRLTTTTAREHQPAWSPDRGQVAFAVGRRAVGVVDLVSGRRHVMTRLPDRFDEIAAIAWSPTGNSVDIGAMKTSGATGSSN